MKDIYDFVIKYKLQHEWRNNSFYIWMPFDILNDFVQIFDFEKLTDYNYINCSLSSNLICINLDEVYYNDEIKKYFPKNF